MNSQNGTMSSFSFTHNSGPFVCLIEIAHPL